MWELAAQSAGNLEGVLGCAMMNEPHRGYTHVPLMHAFDYNTNLHLLYVRKSNSLATHASINPFRSFLLGAAPYPRFNLDLVIPHAYEKDVDPSPQHI